MDAVLFNATRGGKNPLLVLSSSRSELELMVFGLSPIFTWAFAYAVSKETIAIIMDCFISGHWILDNFSEWFFQVLN
jgi:hypothetical protein